MHPPDIGIVMEFAEKGSLFDILDAYRELEAAMTRPSAAFRRTRDLQRTVGALLSGFSPMHVALGIARGMVS